MKKKLLRPIVLLIIFIVAVIVCSFATNKTNEDLTTTMSEASLPVMYFNKDNVKINELHGYVKKMNALDMRDSILPVGADRKMQLMVSAYGQDIDEIDYEIRTMDGERLLANDKLTDITKKDGTINLDIQIPNILTANEECNLIFTLKTSKKEFYYYTRVMMEQDCNTSDCLTFAKEFHEKTFQKDQSDYFLNYIEKTTGDSTTLHYVDLNCSLKQIMWADFEGNISSDLSISYKEINDSYNSIVMKYVLSSNDSQGGTQYYNVEEYYRLRKGTDRMYVLNFERTMDEIFRSENNFKNNKSIRLGIRSNQVEYAASETGDKIAFVQQGELWSYDTLKNELAQIFSFRGYEGIELRENYDQHDIKIVRIDEAGSVDFILYGYMNRGVHEGEVGLGVYHYDGIAHTIEEEAFIPSDCSFGILQAEIGHLMYENENNLVYLMMQGSVFSIDIEALTVKEVIHGVQDGWYSISASNRYFAWVDEGQQFSSKVIHLMDLKTGNSQEITGNELESLRPLGFIEEDFIYGVAAQENVNMDAAGNMIFPMSYINIMNVSDGAHEILKTYQPSGSFVGGISVENYTISIQLIQNSGGQYVAAGADAIMNREADTEMVAFISSEKDAAKETQITIEQKIKLSEKNPKVITSKQVILEQIPEIVLESLTNGNHYCVYAKGKVLLVTDSISDAILTANEQMGVVVDQNEQYVWMRARKNYQAAFTGIAPYEGDANENTILQCISAMLAREGKSVSVKDMVAQGFSAKQILEDGMKDSTVFDLTGCTVEEVIYYVSCNKPVFAMTGTNSAVLITGYTAESISYYDPATKETKAMSREDANYLFAHAGNVFFSYNTR